MNWGSSISLHLTKLTLDGLRINEHSELRSSIALTESVDKLALRQPVGVDHSAAIPANCPSDIRLIDASHALPPLRCAPFPRAKEGGKEARARGAPKYYSVV